VPAGQNLVPVHEEHVYVVHVNGDNGRVRVDQYVKLKVLKHRDNDAVLFEWAPLPAPERAK
jgi:hypothetical protein